ncbi:MAG TPA: hypothetical protein VKO43_06525 [Candidatus Krumholzibacteriaceae bacterium]|nr:hypothetical protein [Candidatus Krumholzibacteriaceae bacterium]
MFTRFVVVMSLISMFGYSAIMFSGSKGDDSNDNVVTKDPEPAKEVSWGELKSMYLDKNKDNG